MCTHTHCAGVINVCTKHCEYFSPTKNFTKQQNSTLNIIIWSSPACQRQHVMYALNKAMVYSSRHLFAFSNRLHLSHCELKHLLVRSGESLIEGTCVYVLKLCITQTFTSHYLYNANKILIKTLMTLLIILILYTKYWKKIVRTMQKRGGGGRELL